MYMFKWCLTRVPKAHNRGRILSSINDAGKIVCLHGKEWTLHKINSKLDWRPKTKTYNYKTRRKHKGKALWYWIWQWFLRLDMKSTATKATIDKWDHITHLNFCTSKEAMNRVKRQPPEWEKMTGNHISDKRLISRIHKELLQLNNKNISNQI